MSQHQPPFVTGFNYLHYFFPAEELQCITNCFNAFQSPHVELMMAAYGNCICWLCFHNLFLFSPFVQPFEQLRPHKTNSYFHSTLYNVSFVNVVGRVNVEWRFQSPNPDVCMCRTLNPTLLWRVSPMMSRHVVSRWRLHDETPPLNLRRHNIKIQLLLCLSARRHERLCISTNR